MKDPQPRVTRLADYRPPAFLVDTVALRFELGDEATLVHSRLEIRRNALHGVDGAPLILNGQGLALVSLTLNGRLLGAAEYQCDAESSSTTNRVVGGSPGTGKQAHKHSDTAATARARLTGTARDTGGRPSAASKRSINSHSGVGSSLAMK